MRASGDTAIETISNLETGWPQRECACVCGGAGGGSHPAGLELLSVKKKERRLLLTQALSLMLMGMSEGAQGQWGAGHPHTPGGPWALPCGFFPWPCIWEGIALGNILGVGGRQNLYFWFESGLPSWCW